MSCVLLMTAATVAFCQEAKTAAPPAQVKTAAQPFSVTFMDGTKVSLESLKGKIVVLNFWFTGCQPCVQEMPQLNALVADFQNKGVVFLAPTWDDAPTTRAFLKDVPFKYTVAPGAGDVILGYSQGGEVIFPTHYVIDREGNVELKVTGVKGLDAVRDALKRLTSSAQVSPAQRKWLDEEVAYIITEQERRAFLALADEAGREQFIRAFWERRDPSPGTRENEYRSEHYRRLAYANQNFGVEGTAGWRTDRGRIYVMYGEPDERRKTSEGEVWTYRAVASQGQRSRLEVEFVAQAGGGDLRLKRPSNVGDIF